MRPPRILTAALLVSAWAVPGAYANNAGPVALADAASPASAAAPAAPAAPAHPAAVEQPMAPAAPAAPTDAAAHAPAPAAPAAAAAEAKPEVVAQEDDPIVCRSQVETGTIGRKQKICMTKSQWEAQRQAARRFKRGIDQSRSTQPGGGG